MADDVSLVSNVATSALANLRKWQARAAGLAAVVVVATALLVASCGQEQQHAYAAAERERHIDSLTAYAAHQKALAAIARRQNNVETRVAQKHAADLHVLRDGVTIDFAAGTIAPIASSLAAIGGPNVTPQAVPKIALDIIAKCDTTVVALEIALSGARALASIEQHRADSLERASDEKDQRPGPRRCGAKCGAAIAIAIREAVPRVFDWLAPRRPSAIASSVPAFPAAHR